MTSVHRRAGSERSWPVAALLLFALGSSGCPRAPDSAAERTIHSSVLTVVTRVEPVSPPPSAWGDVEMVRCIVAVHLDRDGVPTFVEEPRCSPTPSDRPLAAPLAFAAAAGAAVAEWRWRPPRDLPDRSRVPALTHVAVQFRR